jgi:hypothetical protein
MGKGITSEEHESVINILSKRFNLEKVKIIGNNNILGKYFPDMRNETTDYEVEVVPRKSYLQIKKNKWDKLRKKILILKPNSFAYESFDEVYVINQNNELIKLQ